MLGDGSGPYPAVFGYHEDELVGSNVAMLMPYCVAKHHDGFLQRYQEAGWEYNKGAPLPLPGVSSFTNQRMSFGHFHHSLTSFECIRTSK